jgi:hypothetical protein
VTLIKHRIQTLQLREFASFPSQVASAKDMIKEWQRAQQPRFNLVRSGNRTADISADSLPDDPDDGHTFEGER